MGCNSCGGSKQANDQIYIHIDDKQFFVGSRILFFVLKELSPQFEVGKEYRFVREDRKTGTKLSGTLIFKSGGVAYLNGQKLL